MNKISPFLGFEPNMNKSGRTPLLCGWYRFGFAENNKHKEVNKHE